MKIMNKILLVLMIIIVIAGIVMIKINGFNYSLLYSKTQRMNIYLENDFNKNDIKEIAKEVLGSNVEVQYATFFDTVVSITAKDLSEEKQNEIVEKLQEKYEIEIDKENDITIMNIPQINFYDIIESYIIPSITIFVLSIAYIAIRFRKQGIIKSLVIPSLSTILVLGVYISIFAIARIPVNDLFIIFAFLCYLITLICNVIKLNIAEEK